MMKLLLGVPLLLIGCANVTRTEVYDDVVAACKLEEVREELPDLCADPERTATNASLVYEVLRLARGILLP